MGIEYTSSMMNQTNRLIVQRTMKLADAKRKVSFYKEKLRLKSHTDHDWMQDLYEEAKAEVASLKKLLKGTEVDDALDLPCLVTAFLLMQKRATRIDIIIIAVKDVRDVRFQSIQNAVTRLVNQGFVEVLTDTYPYGYALT